SSATTPHRPIEVGVNWMWETTTAALSLVYDGVLDACPGLTVVHPHLGGTLPYLAGRLAGYEELDPGARTSKHPLPHYLHERFYADSLSQTPAAYALAATTYGLDRIVFGSDRPWFPRRRALELLREGLGEEAAERVLENRVL